MWGYKNNMIDQRQEIEDLITSFSNQMENRMLKKMEQNEGWKREFDMRGAKIQMQIKIQSVYLNMSKNPRQDLIDIANYAAMWYDVLEEN